MKLFKKMLLMIALCGAINVVAMDNEGLNEAMNQEERDVQLNRDESYHEELANTVEPSFVTAMKNIINGGRYIKDRLKPKDCSGLYPSQLRYDFTQSFLRDPKIFMYIAGISTFLASRVAGNLPVSGLAKGMVTVSPLCFMSCCALFKGVSKLFLLWNSSSRTDIMHNLFGSYKKTPSWLRGAQDEIDYQDDVSIVTFNGESYRELYAKMVYTAHQFGRFVHGKQKLKKYLSDETNHEEITVKNLYDDIMQSELASSFEKVMKKGIEKSRLDLCRLQSAGCRLSEQLSLVFNISLDSYSGLVKSLNSFKSARNNFIYKTNTAVHDNQTVFEYIDACVKESDDFYVRYAWFQFCRYTIFKELLAIHEKRVEEERKKAEKRQLQERLAQVSV